MNKTMFLPVLMILVGVQSFSQKITIYLDNTPTTPPTITKAPLKYNKDFAYSFTLDDATIDAFKQALPVFQGGAVKETGVTYPGLYYTDGCGNDVNFKCGIAWNTVNASGIDVHMGDVAGLLTWKHLDSLYALGWDVFNHSYSHKSQWVSQMSVNDYSDEILKNQINIKAKTQKNIETPVFVVPSGDANYQDIALQLGHKIVFDQSGNLTGIGGIQVDGEMNLNSLRIHRQLLEESIWNGLLDKAMAKTLNGGHYWYNEFTHRIDNFESTGFNFYSFKNQMQRVADTWGKTGTDKVWMAPLQEVFEYLVFRQAIRYTTSVSNNKLEINIDASSVPTWLRRKTITFIINTSSKFAQVDVPQGIKKSFNGTDNVKIINLDLTNYTANTTPIQEATPSVFKLYPNPSQDILNLELENNPSGNTSFTITDISGKVYLTSPIRQIRQIVDIHDLPQGVYFLKLKQNDNNYISKFIKI